MYSVVSSELSAQLLNNLKAGRWHDALGTLRAWLSVADTAALEADVMLSTIGRSCTLQHFVESDLGLNWSQFSFIDLAYQRRHRFDAWGDDPETINAVFDEVSARLSHSPANATEYRLASGEVVRRHLERALGRKSIEHSAVVQQVTALKSELDRQRAQSGLVPMGTHQTQALAELQSRADISERELRVLKDRYDAQNKVMHFLRQLYKSCKDQLMASEQHMSRMIELNSMVLHGAMDDGLNPEDLIGFLCVASLDDGTTPELTEAAKAVGSATARMRQYLDEHPRFRDAMRALVLAVLNPSKETIEDADFDVATTVAATEVAPPIEVFPEQNQQVRVPQIDIPPDDFDLLSSAAVPTSVEMPAAPISDGNRADHEIDRLEREKAEALTALRNELESDWANRIRERENEIDSLRIALETAQTELSRADNSGVRVVEQASELAKMITRAQQLEQQYEEQINIATQQTAARREFEKRFLETEKEKNRLDGVVRKTNMALNAATDDLSKLGEQLELANQQLADSDTIIQRHSSRAKLAYIAAGVLGVLFVIAAIL